VKNNINKIKGHMVVLLAALLFATGIVYAQPIKLVKGESILIDGVYYSDINIEFSFSRAYLQALNSGLVFDVGLDFLIVNVKPWRVDKEIGQLSQTYTIKYNAFIQRYTVVNTNTGRETSYPTIEIAMRNLGTINKFPVVDDSLINIDENYQVFLSASIKAQGVPQWIKALTFWRDNLDFQTEQIQWPLFK
jgi:hypothetical protein